MNVNHDQRIGSGRRVAELYCFISMARKLNKNLKMRSAAKQPICGLWAAARCCGIRLNSAKKIQEFRDMLLSNKVISRGGNWVGGTTDAERMQICLFLGMHCH